MPKFSELRFDYPFPLIAFGMECLGVPGDVNCLRTAVVRPGLLPLGLRRSCSVKLVWIARGKNHALPEGCAVGHRTGNIACCGMRLQRLCARNRALARIIAVRQGSDMYAQTDSLVPTDACNPNVAIQFWFVNTVVWSGSD